ncbi:MAG: metallophosphoesterase [Chloroflexi bacterium]|nr:MAG: metallophosphoesterase [Chloroflexota bacterium]MBL1195258.1 metallophosphoesterase [Chloroflexota bacterium]NOH12544.1 metallophosphoesterase family protein [Chloroflexota bacterium]
MCILGVIADTHIPDRSKALHPGVLPAFKQAGVEAILHAGDISTPRVIEQLETVAPVIAVLGNRDWVRLRHLPLTRILDYGGLKIGMTHGHGGLRAYIHEKLGFLLKGPQPFSYFVNTAIKMFPEEVDAVIFGHNHAPLNRLENGKLIFNPGSAWRQVPYSLPPSVGLLRIADGKIEGEIVYLEKTGNTLGRVWNPPLLAMPK